MSNLKQKNKYYTGVGSRETPLYIMYMMAQLAQIFEKKGWILRSGCAIGADAAFEDSLVQPEISTEIYVPNNGFARKMNTIHKNYYIIPKEINGTGFDSKYREAMRILMDENMHKAWKNCKEYVLDLHNRNMFQALGKDLQTPSNFLICYTNNREKKYEDTDINTGGTATAINVASKKGIPVFNLSVNEDFMRLSTFISKNDHLLNKEKLLNTVVRSDEYNPHNRTYLELMDIIIQEHENRIQQIENGIILPRITKVRKPKNRV